MSAPVVALYVLVGSISTPGLFGSGVNTVTKRVLPDTERLCVHTPVIKFTLIGAPVVALYVPIVYLDQLGIKRVLPDIAMAIGESSPAMKFAFITAPVVALYSLTVLPFIT